MKFNPDIHKRKSLRLKNYDYFQEGLYFVTISVKDKLCLFGDINDDKLNLFDSGKMIEKYWLELENKFDNVKLHDYVMMPNHFHGIVEIKKGNNKCDCKICRGAPCGYPNNYTNKYPNNYTNKYPDNQNVEIQNNIKINNVNHNQGNHKGCPYNRNILGHIIGGFKSKTTNTYIRNVYKNNRPPFNQKLWQRNYYEHVVRNDESYETIVDYINNNPLKWNEDIFYYTEI